MFVPQHYVMNTGDSTLFFPAKKQVISWFIACNLPLNMKTQLAVFPIIS